MAYNGSGSFTIDTAGNPVSAGTTIDPTVHNTTNTEIATGLTTAICKDGQTTITQNIPFNNKKITGLAAATTRTDGASIATIQDGTGVYVGTVGGTADVITLTPSPAITAYTAGQTFRFIASGANTTTVTANVSAVGAKAVTKNGTTALAAGDIASGAMVEMTYDGTRFVLAATSTSTLNGAAVIGGTMTQVPITQNSQSTAYTTLLTDGGKHLLHPTADNNARTFTIDSNANVAYPVGTTLTFVNQINTLTIAITSDTMTLAGTSTTGSRTLAVNGIATAIKISSTSWIISGTGLA